MIVGIRTQLKKKCKFIFAHTLNPLIEESASFGSQYYLLFLICEDLEVYERLGLEHICQIQRLGIEVRIHVGQNRMDRWPCSCRKLKAGGQGDNECNLERLNDGLKG